MCAEIEEMAVGFCTGSEEREDVEGESQELDSLALPNDGFMQD